MFLINNVDNSYLLFTFSLMVDFNVLTDLMEALIRPQKNMSEEV